MKQSSFSRIAAGYFTLILLAAGTVPGPAQTLPGGPYFEPPGPPIRIISPADHSVFYAPVDIPLFAFTHGLSMSEVEYAQGTFTNVEFYALSNNVSYDLGPAARLDDASRPTAYFDYARPGQMPYLAARFHETWCLVWSNAPPGSFVLTAIAQGRYLLNSITRTSAPVNVTIVSSTNVNSANTVSIQATDPIAIAGTNMFWVWTGVTNPVPSWTNWPPPRWGYFTNWGPKPAVFTVRRFGDVSSALTVNYHVGGTASNGVDYVAIPGAITIPPGGALGLIPIVPVDNGSNNFVRSVILTLTNEIPPTYQAVPPRQAEALIYYRWPRLLPLPLATLPVGGSFLADGTFHVSTGGPDGAWYSIQTSANLADWTSLGTNQVVEGSVDFIDPNPSGSSGFYRVITNLPPQ